MNQNTDLISFVGDPHFFHELMAKLRGYGEGDEGVAAMNAEMREIWNKHITPKHTVYCLGDVAYGRHAKPHLVQKFLTTLNGNICLIRGNHDQKNKALAGAIESRMAWVKDVYMLKVPLSDEDQSTFSLRFGGNVFIWLSHYSHRSWPQQGYGSLHLYGHSHGKLPDWKFSTDVGWDVWKQPVSFDSVICHMARKLFTTEPAA